MAARGGRQGVYGLTRKGHKETFPGGGNVVYLDRGLSCIDDMFQNTEDLYISLCVNTLQKKKKGTTNKNKC